MQGGAASAIDGVTPGNLVSLGYRRKVSDDKLFHSPRRPSRIFVVYWRTVAIFALLNAVPGRPLSGINMAASAKERYSQEEIAHAWFEQAFPGVPDLAGHWVNEVAAPYRRPYHPAPDAGHLGEVVFNGQDIFESNATDLKKLRRDMQIIFQDPYSSLDPRMPIGESIGEGLRVHTDKSGQKRNEIVVEMLSRVGDTGRNTLAATRTSFPAASGSASVLPARWPSNRIHRLRRAGLRAGRVDSGPGA